eukprot:4298085-Prymnesium_polylepis.1
MHANRASGGEGGLCTIDHRFQMCVGVGIFVFHPIDNLWSRKVERLAVDRRVRVRQLCCVYDHSACREVGGLRRLVGSAHFQSQGPVVGVCDGTRVNLDRLFHGK